MGFNSDFVITTFLYCTSTLVVSVLELLTGVPLNNCKLNQSMQLHRKLEIRWIYSQLYLPCFTLLWAPWLFWSAVSTFVRTFLVLEIPWWPLPRASVFVTRCSIAISWTLFVSGRSFFRGSEKCNAFENSSLTWIGSYQTALRFYIFLLFPTQL